MAVNKCIKYLLFVFNLLFWIAGGIILGVSIYLKVTKDKNSLISGSLPGVDLLIAIGVIIMVIGFLGCCGAYRENRCLLLIFFIFLLLIFILLLAAGIVAAVSKDKFKELLKEGLDELIPLTDQPQTVQDDIHKLQKELKCCGLVNGQSDWPVPPPSCKCNVTDTNPPPMCSVGFYSTPCADKIFELMEDFMKITLGIAFAIAILLIFGMVFSMVLYCQISRKEGPTTA
ncbi:tetraspanin-8-like [Pholidichthys leucotaenia]